VVPYPDASSEQSAGCWKGYISYKQRSEWTPLDIFFMCLIIAIATGYCVLGEGSVANRESIGATPEIYLEQGLDSVYPCSPAAPLHCLCALDSSFRILKDTFIINVYDEALITDRWCYPRWARIVLTELKRPICRLPDGSTVVVPY
jgi:hypothetical protein